jgi:hypothetical protein
MQNSRAKQVSIVIGSILLLFAAAYMASVAIDDQARLSSSAER